MKLLDVFGRHRNVAITSPAIPQIEGIHGLDVVRIEGSESLDTADMEYKVLLKTPAELAIIPDSILLQSFDEADFIGQQATLHIALDDAHLAGANNTRYITGIISNFQFKRVAERALHFELTLKGWLWLGTLTTDYVIHQNKTVVDILRDTLNSVYPYMFDVRLNNSYPMRDYCVRMNEFADVFVRRLCQEYGINLHYEHGDNSSRLILSDDNNAFKPFPSPAYQTIRYHADPHSIDEEHFHTFSPSRSLTTGKTTYRDYNYIAPDATNEVEHGITALTRSGKPVNHSDYEQYHYHSDPFSNTVQPRAGTNGANDPVAEGQVFTREHLQSLRQHDERATAAGNVRAAVVGRSFNLIDHPIAQANIEYIVVSAKLLVEEVAHETQRMTEPQEWRVETQLVVQPRTIPLKPNRTLQKPRIHGVEVAKVVGYNGDTSVWTDDLGRVRVAFPWHRNEPNDETSTCWVRVASNWAGNQRGGIHLPRINDEVLISYLGGDCDLPIITGQVYNATHLPPWELPKNQALSGFRSRELAPGNQATGASNHLVLDDSTQAIQAQLVSEHAQSSLSLGNIRGISGNEGLGSKRGSGFALESKDWGVMRSTRGMHVTTYGRDNVSSPIKSMDETIAQLQASVEQHKTSTEAAIKHNAYDESLDAATQSSLKEQLKAIKGEGDEFPELSEAHMVLSSPVGMEMATEGSVHIASKAHTAISAGGELSFSVVKRLFASVGSGIRLFAQSKGIWLKSAKDPIRLEAQDDNIELEAEKDVLIKAKKVVRIDAADELILSCQGNFIKMSGAGVEIGTPTQTKHYGPFSVLGPKSLAQLFNEMPKSKFDQELFLMQPNGKPAKNMKFEIHREDGSVIKGVTDASGNTKVQKAPSWGQYTMKIIGRAD